MCPGSVGLFTADGARMIFERNGGPVNGCFGAAAIRIYAELHFDGLHSCLRTVTADGCELLFEAFFFSLEEGAKPAMDGLFLARRAP